MAPKSPRIYKTYTFESRNLLCFSLRLAFPKIFATYNFPISHNVTFQSIFIFVFNLKFKIPRSNFYMDCQKEQL